MPFNPCCLLSLVVLGVVGCEKLDDTRELPAIPGPVANVRGRVMRGAHPVAGVHVLARITQAPGCRVTDSAPGGTVVSAAPTDSTGRFHTVAYAAVGAEQRAGCLHIGAADPVRAETVWAAPRPWPGLRPGASPDKLPPVITVDVPWPGLAAPALDPTRFEPEIHAFEAADRASPPRLGGVVFVGSSSIKNWTEVTADFPGLPVLNRGFGGSTLADVVYYVGRTVLPYQPRLVVLYAGDNDLAEGRTPERVMGDYRAFVASLKSALPAARVVYVSIKPSPSRRAYMERARETNQRIRAEVARDSLQAYVDVFTPMLGASGQPRPELFLADSLHMTRAGYLLWRALLSPVVH